MRRSIRGRDPGGKGTGAGLLVDELGSHFARKTQVAAAQGAEVASSILLKTEQGCNPYLSHGFENSGKMLHQRAPQREAGG